MRVTRIWLGLGLLGAAAGGAVISSSHAADGTEQPPLDAQMLLDLDLLKSTDLKREGELYKRMPVLENMRILESMPTVEGAPKSAPAATEAKDR